MWTTMMALVRDVILSATCSGHMFQVEGSASTSTGIAPALTMAAAQEMIVKVGRMTSSPEFSWRAATAAVSAAEPLQTATPCLRLTRLANSLSNRWTYGPSDE